MERVQKGLPLPLGSGCHLHKMFENINAQSYILVFGGWKNGLLRGCKNRPGNNRQTMLFVTLVKYVHDAHECRENITNYIKLKFQILTCNQNETAGLRKLCKFRLKSMHFPAKWMPVSPKSWETSSPGASNALTDTAASIRRKNVFTPISLRFCRTWLHFGLVP